MRWLSKNGGQRAWKGIIDMATVISREPFVPRELRGELARICDLEDRVAALETEYKQLKLLLQDVVGDFPRGIRSNAVEAAREYLEEA
jgi:cell shape-determining protein MreC